MDTSERDMRNLILRAEEDKKRLAQRIEKLTANGIVLVKKEIQLFFILFKTIFITSKGVLWRI